MRSLRDIFIETSQEHTPYLSQWYLDKAAVISTKTYAELREIQRLLHRAIKYFIENHSKYTEIFPRTDFMARLAEAYDGIPYRVGTYRPDFLIEAETGDLKICEIGARFPLNGYFASGFAEQIGVEKFPEIPQSTVREYERFLAYLFEYWGTGFDSICVLKGSDRPCDVKYYISFFEKLGYSVKVFSPESIVRNTDALLNAAVVNEFNQMEIEQLPADTIRAIAGSNALNDMRSIFLMHDKQFLAILSNDSFLENIMNRQERVLLKKYLIPTFTRSQSKESWEDALKNRDKWLIKHALLGKSEQVYAGCLCGEEEWRKLFFATEIDNMVLQPYIKQRQIEAKIGNTVYRDYVVGTMLCFDDHFFGPGIFRTSSHEITNRVDDRKMAACISDTTVPYALYI